MKLLSVLSVNKTFSMLLIKSIAIIYIFLPIANCVLRLPEFTEPIKNMTLLSGSDVEFSCDVKYLGTYRVAWSWKKDDEQKILGIGIVKITRSNRVHISRIQKSDDVTQFNLYIYNIKPEDDGAYHCSVNSNPMIEQIGTLEVFTNGNDESSERIPHAEVENENTSVNSSIQAINLQDNHSDKSSESETANQNVTDENSTESSINVYQNSTMLCIDLNDVWDSAKERIADFLSAVAKFTYSYWFS